MSWRIIVVQNLSKLSYKNGYLLVRQEEVQMIHLSEVGVLLLESTAISITGKLLEELVMRKVNVIFCDSKRNPISQLVPFYGSHNSSQVIKDQTEWQEIRKDLLWQKIVEDKIQKQAEVLMRIGNGYTANKLLRFSKEVEPNDIGNKEAIAAKMYFSTLFGQSFTRQTENSINAALNYGYTLLLSSFNREITSKGFLSQIGLHHKNRFNHFNLSSDLMESFRPIIDEYVYHKQHQEFDQKYKKELIELLNLKVRIRDTNQYLGNAISIYVSSIMKSMDEGKEINIFPYSLDLE